MNKLWWTLLIRGIAAILFGITAIAWPGLTLIVLIYMFAFFTIVDGALIIASSFMDSNRDENWWLMLLLGISLAGFGGITLFRPEVTALLLLLLIAARFLVSGILEIVIAIRLRKEIEGEFFSDSQWPDFVRAGHSAFELSRLRSAGHGVRDWTRRHFQRNFALFGRSETQKSGERGFRDGRW